PWGVEVTVPDGFDYLLADRKVQRSPAQWAALGVLNTSGEAVPDHGLASILLPGGSDGAAFMIFSNFEVIERYNTADAYVIGIGHLSDRIAGGAPIVQGWPTQDRSLTFDERIDLQTQLTALGFDTVKIDAKIGPLTINAVRGFQLAQGLLPDGYASPRLLDRVRAAR
ncbi:MAG: peptidoglycan-binding protein, partial [Sulfitobacter sp.]|nr:peptidoglycan-binding protein [Sulfitobacter sp.]